MPHRIRFCKIVLINLLKNAREACGRQSDKDIRVKKKTYKIDARCANLEAVCYNLIATQSPVASDFRLLQTIIYIDFNLQRMSDKVRRIARAAKRKVNNDIEFPAEMVAPVSYTHLDGYKRQPYRLAVDHPVRPRRHADARP